MRFTSKRFSEFQIGIFVIHKLREAKLRKRLTASHDVSRLRSEEWERELREAIVR